MFKFIFKGITLFFFLVFLIVSLAIWKGGEPFRWIGDGLVIMGERVNGFGNSVDKFIKGSKEISKNVEKIKKAMSLGEDESR